MKIAFLSTFYPFRGGIAQFNHNLYHAFEKTHEVVAYTFTVQYPDFLFPGETQFVTDEDNVDLIPADRILSTVNPLTFGKAASHIWAEHPDILVMKFWMPFFAPSLGTVARQLRKKGVKTISVLDNAIPHEKRLFDKQLVRYFLNANDGFIVMSKSVEDDLKKLKPQASYTYHPHPVYDHFGEKMDQKLARKSLQIPVDKTIILFFGFIRDYKGLDVLLEAMPLIHHDVHLVIAGESYGSFEKYQSIIDQHQLAERLTLHIKYISDQDVARYFSAADLVVLPYKSATQSGIVQIACHFETPVIATDVGGLSEMLIDGKTGVLIPEADPRLIADSVNITRFANRLDEITSHMKAIKQTFNWQTLADSIVTLALDQPAKGG